jgi:23S rRNA (uracil1939-C5)-methyltransferase
VLADRFSRVVAVEGAEAAIPSLLAAARSQRAIEPVHSATLDFLRAREIQRERPTLIVLDPPRAGLGPEAAKILGRLGAPRLVYISCDPESLILDLAHLIPTHEVTAIHLIDLFPETFHLETIVQLKRK